MRRTDDQPPEGSAVVSDIVFFIVELEIRPDQGDELEDVMQEMADRTRADEPGTLEYQWFLNADGDACYICERYADADAAVAHSRSFSPELEQRAQAFRPVRLTAFGELTPTIEEQRIEPLLAAVPDINYVSVDPRGGFARSPAGLSS